MARRNVSQHQFLARVAANRASVEAKQHLPHAPKLRAMQLGASNPALLIMNATGAGTRAVGARISTIFG